MNLIALFLLFIIKFNGAKELLNHFRDIFRYENYRKPGEKTTIITNTIENQKSNYFIKKKNFIDKNNDNEPYNIWKNEANNNDYKCGISNMGLPSRRAGFIILKYN